MAGDNAQTWHYGLVARCWAEQNTGGPEIAYYKAHIERHGQPALDAGCGTGRLLIPFLRSGLDVDGCDVSADMLALCREKAEAEDLSPRLYQQALHELDLPRQYRTIVACGVFGIGVSRAEDALALDRLYQHVEPGGVLLLDHQMAYTDADEWQLWLKDVRDQLPQPWPDSVGQAPPADGADYTLHTRVVAFDPLEQQITRQMRAVLWRDGEAADEEEYLLTENLYFCSELACRLEQAGFKIEAIQGGYTGAEATADDDFIVFIARK